MGSQARAERIAGLAVARLGAGTFLRAAAASPSDVLGIDELDVQWALCSALKNLSRLALLTTVTEDKAMAAPAIMGLSSRPVSGYKIPAAIGIPSEL